MANVAADTLIFDQGPGEASIRSSAGNFVGGVFVATGDVNEAGEDSRGLWQINIEPSQHDPDPDRFDCSELVQWASARAHTAHVAISLGDGGDMEGAGIGDWSQVSDFLS